MYDMTEFVTRAEESFKQAAEDSLQMGLPVVFWDSVRKKIIKRWPDGREEELPSYQADPR